MKQFKLKLRSYSFALVLEQCKATSRHLSAAEFMTALGAQSNLELRVSLKNPMLIP